MGLQAGVRRRAGVRRGGAGVGALRADDEPPDESPSDALAEAAHWVQQMVRELHEACPNHPVLKDLEKVGNGVFEDDYSLSSDLPHFRVPSWFFRFRRDSDAAYLWLDDGAVWISPWHPLRPRRRQPGRTERRLASIREALDALNVPRRPARRWWQFWKAEN